MKKAWAALLLSVAMVMTACAPKAENAGEAQKEEGSVSQEETNQSKDSLVYAVWDSPAGVFNPLISEVQQDGYVNDIVYDSLIDLNADMELEPSLASAFEMSEDGKMLSFTLRQDVKWHDGKPFGPDDVVFTLTQLAHKDYPGEYYSRVEKIVGADKVHEGTADKLEGLEVNEDKLIIHFSEPFAPALNALGTTPILPKHIWETVAVDKWESETEKLNAPVGTGPYKVAKFNSGEGVEFEAFSEFFKGEPKIKSIQMKVFNPDTAQAEILQGNIDIAELSNFRKEDISALEEKGLKIASYPTSNIQYMGMNTQNPVLSDVKVRQAIAYGIDRQGIVNELLEGKGVLINAPMVPTLWSYPKSGLTEYSKDDAKAKELLKEAGYEDTDGDGFVDKNGEKLSFELVVPLGNKTRELTGPIIQNNLKDIGIDIVIDAKEFPAVMDQVVERREYDMYLMANTLDLDPDPKPNWYSTASWNFVGYINPKTDELIDRGLTAVDQSERAKIYQEFGTILNRDVPWLPLYAPDVMTAYQQNIENYRPNTFVPFYNIENWSVK